MRGRAEGQALRPWGCAAEVAARPRGGGGAPVGAAGGIGDGGLRCAGKAALGAEVGVLLCDVGDAASLAAMARQTRLVLNCVGPVSAVVRAVLPAASARRARLPAEPGAASAPLPPLLGCVRLGSSGPGELRRLPGNLPLGSGISGAVQAKCIFLKLNQKYDRVL